MHHLSRLTRAAALAIVALVLTAAASPAFAADPTIRLDASAGDGNSWVLTAQVDDASGNAVSNANVDFAVQVSFMGSDRMVTIGSAITDTSGAASIEYVPTWNGHQVLTATVHGSAAASDPAEIDVSNATPVIPPDPPTLGLLRTVTPPVVVLVVLCVWLLIGGTFLYAVLGVARPRSRVKGHAGVSVPGIAAVESRRGAQMG